MTLLTEELMEKAARLIAYWHGQKIVARTDETVTVASRKGYGLWGHSPEKYAENHWREYVDAASESLTAILPDIVEACAKEIRSEQEEEDSRPKIGQGDRYYDGVKVGIDFAVRALRVVGQFDCGNHA